MLWRSANIYALGNREHVWYVQCIYVHGTVYSTCKWDRIVRTVVQYVLWCHKSHKQANKNLHMKVTATKPNYKGERYQLTATCDYSGAVLTKTLKTRDLLVPCLKRWNSQVTQPQGIRSAISVPIILRSLLIPSTQVAIPKGTLLLLNESIRPLPPLFVVWSLLVTFSIALSPSSTIQLRISIIVHHMVEQEMKRHPTSSFTTRSQISATYEPLDVQLTSTNLEKCDPSSILRVPETVLLSATILVKIVNTLF